MSVSQVFISSVVLYKVRMRDKCYLNIVPAVSYCSRKPRPPPQSCRTQRTQCSLQSLPSLHAVCSGSVSSSGGSCPGRAKTHRSSHRTRSCTRPSRGRNRRSRPVSFVGQSTPLVLWFGHNRHGRHPDRRGSPDTLHWP